MCNNKCVKCFTIMMKILTFKMPQIKDKSLIKSTQNSERGQIYPEIRFSILHRAGIDHPQPVAKIMYCFWFTVKNFSIVNYSSVLNHETS